MKQNIERIHKLIRHTRGVQENALVLGERLIAAGHFHLGKDLIANSFLHDLSKFRGMEWTYLTADNADPHDLKIAIQQHNQTNEHHPEYYEQGIHGMPREALAELVCDWKARSAESGTSLRDWIIATAFLRYGFSEKDPVYETLMEFVNLLLDPPLRNVDEI